MQQAEAQAIGFAIAALVAAWVVADATTRGKKGGEAILWGLGTLLIMIIFLPLYLYRRSKETVSAAPRATSLCRYCGLYFEGDPFYCPHCSKQLKGVGAPRS